MILCTLFIISNDRLLLIFTLSPPPHVPGYNSSVGSHTLPGDNKIWLFMIQTILSTFTGKWKFLWYCSNYYIIHILYCSDENMFTKCYMLIFKQNYLSISQPNHFSGILKWFTIAIKLLNQIQFIFNAYSRSYLWLIYSFNIALCRPAESIHTYYAGFQAI